jgi:3-hydroxyisobutyrate dehydrogenase-like beta-hydroxyacid dehydrogenase
MSKPVVGVVGLGIMGGAMAEALVKAGYSVCGFDVVAAACRRLKQAGGRPLKSPAQVAEQADMVIVSLSTTEALQSVVQDICASQVKKDAKKIVIETSTLPLSDKEDAYKKLKRKGLDVLDCPISGTAVRMKERAWTVFVSGSKTSAKRVDDVLRVFTDKVPYVGVYGNGTKMKFSANHLVAIYNVACAEAVNLARKMGLDPQDVLDMFGSSPIIGTGVMRLRMPFMIERSYSPPTMKVEVWQKDMQVIGDLAKSVDCPTPLFTTCASIYTAAMAQGLAQQDTASVSEVLANMAGVPAQKTKAKNKRSSKSYA